MPLICIPSHTSIILLFHPSLSVSIKMLQCHKFFSTLLCSHFFSISRFLEEIYIMTSIIWKLLLKNFLLLHSFNDHSRFSGSILINIKIYRNSQYSIIHYRIFSFYINKNVAMLYIFFYFLDLYFYSLFSICFFKRYAFIFSPLLAAFSFSLRNLFCNIDCDCYRWKIILFYLFSI